MNHVRKLHHLLTGTVNRLGTRPQTSHPLLDVVGGLHDAVDEAVVNYWWGLVLREIMQERLLP